MKRGSVLACSLVAAVLGVAACSTSSSPTGGSPTPVGTPETQPSFEIRPNLVRDGRVGCFVAAMQRSKRSELREEIGARSNSLAALLDALVGSVPALNQELDEEQVASFRIGCRQGLRGSGILDGEPHPMSSSEVLPMFVQVCSGAAQSFGGDLGIAAEALKTEADPEAVARAFVSVLSEERGVPPPETAIQACAQGFLRVFSGI